MSEELKLHVFIQMEIETNLRFLYVCEENSHSLQQELQLSTDIIKEKLIEKGLLEALALCETDMFSKISKHP
jgi:hypothetical protein